MSYFRKTKKKPATASTNKNKTRPPQHNLISKKDATKIIDEQLTPQIFYAITRDSEKSYQDMMDKLQIMTENYLGGNNTADMELLRSMGLFRSINNLFKSSHAVGHLAGGGGVIGHGGLGRREKCLLALVQRWARRDELSQEVSVDCEFLDTLILRSRYMIGSLQKFCSSQGQDEVIEEEINSSSDDDDDDDDEPGQTLRLPAITTPQKVPLKIRRKNTLSPKLKIEKDTEQQLETRLFEFKHRFETNCSLGIRIKDQLAADINTKKKLKIKTKKKKKGEELADDQLGLFVESLVDHGQADNLNRMKMTLNKGKHLDDEIREGDKIICVNTVDVSKFTGKQFVTCIKEKGEKGTKPVQLKFRGTRIVKKRKKKTIVRKPTALITAPPIVPTAPTTPKKNTNGMVGKLADAKQKGSRRRRKLVHKKGSLGGGKSERGGKGFFL